MWHVELILEGNGFSKVMPSQVACAVPDILLWEPPNIQRALAKTRAVLGGSNDILVKAVKAAPLLAFDPGV